MDPGPWTPAPRPPPRWPSELPFAEMPSRSDTVSNKAGDHLLAAKSPGSLTVYLDLELPA